MVSKNSNASSLQTLKDPFLSQKFSVPILTSLESPASPELILECEYKTILGELEGHGGSINAVEVTSNSEYLITGSSDKTIIIWSLLLKSPVSILSGHEKEVLCLSLTFNDSLLLSGSSDNSCKIWDFKSKTLLFTLSGHLNSVVSVTASEANRLIITGSLDRSLKIWTSSGELLQTFNLHSEAITSCIAFENLLISSSSDKTLKLWDLNSLTFVRDLIQASAGLVSLAMSSDGKKFAVAESNSNVKVFGFENFQVQFEILDRPRIRLIRFAGNGEVLACCSEDFYIYFWDLKTRRRSFSLRFHPKRPNSFAVSSDCSLVVTGCNDKTLRLWSSAERRDEITLYGHSAMVRDIDCDMKGKLLVSGSHDETIRLWDLNKNKESWVFQSTENQVSSCRVMKKSKKCFITGHEDGSIKFWGLKTLEIDSNIKIHSKEISSLDVFHNSRLASGSLDGQIIIWDLESRQIDFVLKDSSSVTCVVFFKLQEKLASASDENFIKIWDLQEKELNHCLKIHESPIFSLFLTIDDNFFITGCKDNSIRLLNIENQSEKTIIDCKEQIETLLIWSEDEFLILSTRNQIKVNNFPEIQEVFTLEGHESTVKALAQIDSNHLASGSEVIFIWNLREGQVVSTVNNNPLLNTLCTISPSLLLISSIDKTISLIDLSTKKIDRIIYTSIGKVFSVVLSKDAQFIISGSDSNAVLVMNVKKKTIESRLSGHCDAVWTVSLSSDEKLIASGSKDKTIKIWDFLNRKENFTLSGHSLTVMSLAFTNDNKTLVSGSFDKKLIVWSLESRSLEHIFEQHANPVTSIVISSSKQVYSASNDNNIKIFTLFPKKLVYTSPKSQNSIESLCFSHNEEFLAYAEFNTIVVFNTKTRKIEFSLVGHARNYVYSVRFTEDSRKIISASGEGCIKTWNLGIKTEEKTIFHDNYALAVIFLQKLQKVACGLENGGLMVWDYIDGQEFYSVHGEQDSILTLSASPCQDFIAGCSKTGSLKIWNISKKKLEHSFSDLKNPLKAIFFLDDRNLALGTFEGIIKIWDIHSRITKFSLFGHSSEIRCFCRYDEKLVSGANDGKIIFWESRSVLFELFSKSEEITFLAQHGSQMISGSLDFILRVWNVENREVVSCLSGHSDRITCILSLNENNVVSCSFDQSVKVWDLREMKEVKTFKPGKEKVVGMIKVNEWEVLTCSLDKCLKTWKALDGDEIKTFKMFQGKVWSIFASQEFLFVGTDSFAVNCMNLKDFSEFTVFIGHTATVRCLMFSEKKQVLFSGSFDNCVNFWDVRGKVLIESRKEHTHWVRCLELTDDHQQLISGSQDATIKIWEVTSRKVITTLRGHKSSVTSLKFNQLHRSLISASSDCSIIIWDMTTFSEILSLKCHKQTIWSVLLIKNNNWFATGSEDKQIKIWDFVKRREIFSLQGHQGPVEVLLESRCMKFLISGSSDFSIKIWNLNERRLEFTLSGHKDHVYSLALNLQGDTLFTGSLDRTIKVWDLFRDPRKEGRAVPIIASDLCIYQEITTFGRVVSHDDIFPDDSKINYEWTPSSVFDSFCQEKQIFYNIIDSIKSGSFENLSSNANTVMFGKYDLTLSHFLAFLGKNEVLETLLGTSCLIQKDKFGKSPFYYAILKKNHKSIEILMNSLIELIKTDSSPFFQTSFHSISQDLPLIIRSSPSKLVHLLNQLLLSSETCLFSRQIKLPCYSFNTFPKPAEEDFDPSSSNEVDAFAVIFSYLPIEVPFIPGSSKCLDLLDSLITCKDRQIFTTPFVSRFIDYEWRSVKLWVVCYSFLLFSNLGILVVLSGFKENFELLVALVVVNSLLFLWEVAQLLVTGLKYFSQIWNLLDVLRIGLTFGWMLNVDSDLNYLEEIVIMTNFIRGLTAFKLFDGTRFYIDLIFRSINDVKYFLLLFFYSNLMFGALNSVKAENNLTFNSLWLDIYSLNFGMYDESNKSVIQVFIFMSATFINLIVMLNLLISILGDSHDQFQVERIVIDNYEKAELCLEIQKMFFWRRGNNMTGFLHVVNHVTLGEENSWEGRIVFLQKMMENLGNLVSQSQKEVVCCLNDKIDGKFSGFDKNFASIGEMENRIKDFIVLNEGKNEKIVENGKSFGRVQGSLGLVSQKSEEKVRKNDERKLKLAVDDAQGFYEGFERKIQGIKKEIREDIDGLSQKIEKKMKDIDEIHSESVIRLEKRLEVIESGISKILDKLN